MKSHPCPDRQAGPVHEGNSRTMNMHSTRMRIRTDNLRGMAGTRVVGEIEEPFLPEIGVRTLSLRRNGCQVLGADLIVQCGD